MATAVVHDGVTVEITSHGEGPAVLMHPLPRYTESDGAELDLKARLDRALVEQLSDRFRLIMFEYPGAPKPETLTIANVVPDLLAIADAAGAERFAWCGYSWTGIIGLHLAFASDRLTALVCGGWPPVNGPYARMLELVSARPEGALADYEVAGLQQFTTFYTPLQGFDDRAPQAQVTCPRLCLASTTDDIYGSGIGATIVAERELLERLGWDVRLVEGLDHMAVLEPDVFVPLVGEWLDAHLLA
jgi:pimeloyl-ACP methyl ester carboxylesterase